MGPEQRRTRGGGLIGAGGGIVEHRAIAGLVPGDQEARIAACGEIRGGEEAPGLRMQQQRAVAPVPHEVAVVPAFLDHHAGNAQREGAVAARPDAEPEIGLVGEAGLAGIDDDEPGASRLRRRGTGGVGEPGGAGIVAPEQDAAGIGEVGRRHAHAEGIGAGVILVPVAELGAVDPVRAAEGVDEALDPENAVGERGGAGGRHREGDALGAALVAEASELAGRCGQRLVPADALPPRIGVALGPRALQGIEEAVAAVDQLRRRAALDAERAAGGMVGIGLDLDQPAVLHRRDAAATRAAERAVAAHFQRRASLRHRRLLAGGIAAVTLLGSARRRQLAGPDSLDKARGRINSRSNVRNHHRPAKA